MIVGSSQLDCAAFLKQVPNFNSLLTVNSDIEVLFALSFFIFVSIHNCKCI
jgi:hypothetical protein